MQRSFVQPVAVIVIFISVAATISLYSNQHGLSNNKPQNVGATSLYVPPDPCSVPKEKHEKLNASEAVRLAECYIVRNGYTDVPPVSDKSAPTSESVNPDTEELAMRMRRGSVEPKAYGFMRVGSGSNGWTVVFRKKYKAERAKLIPNYEEQLRKTGRAVTMDAYGNDMRVEHQDFNLDFPEIEILNPQVPR